MKYIVLTDIHLGQNKDDMIKGGQYCLLSHIHPKHDEAYSRSRKAIIDLSRRVKEFAKGGEVELIVTGDFLDLSLAFMKDSMKDLVHMLRALPSVSTVIYVAGNHDHHIWTAHSEHKNSTGMMEKGSLPRGGSVYKDTPEKGEFSPAISNMCTSLLQREIVFRIAYPVFSFEENGELYYFTHGHLFGGLYTAMSDILKGRLTGLDAASAAAIVNAPLIEFIYWSLSQVGNAMGADGFVEQIYADIQTGKKSNIKKLIGDAVTALTPDGVIPIIPDSVEKWVVVKSAMAMIGQIQGKKKSNDRHKEKKETRNDLLKWVEDTGLSSTQKTHFFYGHTHVADKWNVLLTNIMSYNLGSWLVEPGHEHPSTKIAFIDTREGTVLYE